MYRFESGFFGPLLNMLFHLTFAFSTSTGIGPIASQSGGIGPIG